MKKFLGILLLGLLGGVTAALVYLLRQPEIGVLRMKNPATTALIELRQRQVKKAGLHYPTRMVWRDLDEISPHLVHAVLLAEDDRFYQHQGFDLEQMREAVQINWREKRYAYGASTITQQLARTLFLSPRKNLLRKTKEAIITYRLEKTLPKKRILELYLNVAEWGQGLYGAEAAAMQYFEKPASELTPDEAIALASILPSPRRWSPRSEKAFMARRRTRLLERMRRAGYVPPEPSPYLTIFEPALPSPERPQLDELQGVHLEPAPEPSAEAVDDVPVED